MCVGMHRWRLNYGDLQNQFVINQFRICEQNQLSNTSGASSDSTNTKNMGNLEVFRSLEYHCKVLTKLACYPTRPDNKLHGANMGPTWVLSAPDGPHVGPMILATQLDYGVCIHCMMHIWWWMVVIMVDSLCHSDANMIKVNSLYPGDACMIIVDCFCPNDLVLEINALVKFIWVIGIQWIAIF